MPALISALITSDRVARCRASVSLSSSRSIEELSLRLTVCKRSGPFVAQVAFCNIMQYNLLCRAPKYKHCGGLRRASTARCSTTGQADQSCTICATYTSDTLRNMPQSLARERKLSGVLRYRVDPFMRSSGLTGPKIGRLYVTDQRDRLRGILFDGLLGHPI
jgi:hypothetical protein